MEDLSPESKALYELLMIDTKEECEKRFLDYKRKVLAAMKSTEPLSAPSGAASSSCFREPCPRSTLTSTAASASSNITSDGLSPGSRRLYDNLDESATATSFPTSAPAISAARSTATSIPAATSTHLPVAPQLDSTSASVHSSSTATAPTTPEARHLHNLIVGGSASRVSATPEVSSMPPSPTEIDDIQVAADIGAALAPTTCSAECPSHDASVYADAVISSATPISSTTSDSDFSKVDAPVASDQALDGDAMGDAALMATICMRNGPDISSGDEEPQAISLIPRSAPTSLAPLQMFETAVINRCSVHCSVEDTYVLMPKFNSALLPWPSFKCSQFWTSLVRQVKSEPREQFSYLVALHSRATSLQQLRIPWVHHETLKHDKIIWCSQRLRPPWPPPELEMVDCHIEEAARGWTHRLEIVGSIVLHPLGKCVSSHSPFADNEISSPCVKSFLDDVLWKRHKWWSNIPCIRRTNAILDTFSWLWITGKHAEVQLQLSYPLFPVTCHFVRVHFLLSRKAQVNVESNRGTSFNLVIYCGYPALNIAHAHYWKLIIVGHLLQYCLEEADALLLLISWLHEPYLQLFPGLPCAVPRYIYCSYGAFLVSLNGRAEVHILQEREPLYSYENFQWTIAWSLDYDLSLSVPWLFRCPLPVKLVELKPWPSWGLFLCISVVNKNLDISHAQFRKFSVDIVLLLF